MLAITYTETVSIVFFIWIRADDAYFIGKIYTL